MNNNAESAAKSSFCIVHGPGLQGLLLKLKPKEPVQSFLDLKGKPEAHTNSKCWSHCVVPFHEKDGVVHFGFALSVIKWGSPGAASELTAFTTILPLFETRRLSKE